MTVAEMIERAKAVQALCAEDSTPSPLADAVLDLLAEAAPCGLAAPIFHHGGIDVPCEWTGELVSAEDARHMARMLLRAADEAEAKP